MRKLVIAVSVAVLLVLLWGGKVVVDRLARPMPLKGELRVTQLAPQPGGMVSYVFEIRATPGARCYAFMYRDVLSEEPGLGLEEELAGGWRDRLLRRTLTFSVRGAYIDTPPEAIRVEAGKTYPLEPGEPLVIADFSDDRGFWHRWVAGISGPPPEPN